jgi:hypothetical protein
VFHCGKKLLFIRCPDVSGRSEKENNKETMPYKNKQCKIDGQLKNGNEKKNIF